MSLSCFAFQVSTFYSFDCSFRKYVIENICVSLYATAVPELLFQQQLYTFETENGCIEPVNLQAMCNRGHGIHNDLLFGHEWTRQKVPKIIVHIYIIFILLIPIFLYSRSIRCCRIMLLLLWLN